MILRVLRLTFPLAFLGLAISGYLGWISAIASCALCLAANVLDYAWQKNPSKDDLVELAIGLDVLAACIVLSSLGIAETFGFLALLPIALRWNTIRVHGDRIGMTAGSFVLLAGWAESSGVYPNSACFYQASGVVITLTIANYYRNANQITKPILMPTNFIANNSEPTQASDDLQRLIELRESYRQLRTTYNQLVKRSKIDHVKCQLIEWRLADERNIRDLTNKIQEALGVEAVSIYTVPDSRIGMVLAGSSGDAPQATSPLDIPLQVAPILMKERAEKALRAIADPSNRHVANTLLIDKGRVLGLAVIYDKNDERLEESKGLLDSIAPFVARLICDSHEEHTLRSRALQAEMLAELTQSTSNTSGADAAATIVSDLLDALKLDGCSIWDFSDPEPRALASVGENPIAGLEFSDGNGLAGWVKAGANELIISDLRSDGRFGRKPSVRQSVGMAVVMPLRSSGSVVGALVTHALQPHGITASSLGVLRSILPNAVRRIFGGFATVKPGLVDPETFWQNSRGPGSFVEINLGEDQSGSQADQLRKARRQFLASAMSRLPDGGLISRRESGTLIVFLPGFDEVAAERWGLVLTPFAIESFDMNVKALKITSQKHQFFDALAS